MLSRLHNAEVVISHRLRWALLGSVGLTALLFLLIIFMMYRAALQAEARELSGMLSMQRQLVHAVAQFDAKHSVNDVAGGAFAATAMQVQDAWKDQSALGKSGEILVAHRRAGQLKYLASRHQAPETITKASLPLEAALQRKTGVLEATDYRGHDVIAAYTWVPCLAIALVAKRDMAELREPYISSAIATIAALFFIFIGTVLVYRKTARPIFAELHDRANLFEGLFVDGPDAIILHDENAKIVDSNRVAQELFGYSKADFVGQQLMDFSPQVQPGGASSAQMQRDILAREARRESFRIDWCYQSATGHLFNAEVAFAPVTLLNQTWFVITIRDLSERQHMQADLDAAQKRVSEQRDALAHADRAYLLGEMTTSIAHEISQPLAAIDMYSAAARERLTADPPQVENALRNIEKLSVQAERSASVVSRIRDLAVKKPALLQAVDVQGLIDEVLALAEPDLRRNAMTLKVQGRQAAAMVSIDTVQIQQVLLNVIRNGMHAHIEANCTDQPLILLLECREDVVEIRLSDAGPGLPEDGPERVFERYYSTRKTGMGMGLPISRSICEAHGGTLTAGVSGRGGAEFVLTLPRLRS